MSNCTNPRVLLSPESRWLRKCRFEGRSFEYYQTQARARRNLVLDPSPLVDNPSDYYANLPASRQQVVPCGKCENCLKRKVNDYFIRCYFQYLETSVGHHGSTFFITLTYADALVPKYNGIMCFDSEHICNFLKRLRRKLEPLRIKHFIVSELGTDPTSTHRSHYHGLLFIDDMTPSERNRYIVMEAVAMAWTKEVDRSKQFHQLFDCQRIDCQLLTDVSRIHYVCKYIGKQIGAEILDNMRVPHRYGRNHWQSDGLGSRIYDYCNHDALESGLVEVDGFKYALPKYYQLKLKREFYCYNDKSGSIIYQPTDYALMAQKALFISLLTEYKKLCVLNKGFPVPPIELYDPDNIDFLERYMDAYNGLDPNSTLDMFDTRFSELMVYWSNYVDEVANWYKPHAQAMAMKYLDDQKKHFRKNAGM